MRESYEWMTSNIGDVTTTIEKLFRPDQSDLIAFSFSFGDVFARVM